MKKFVVFASVLLMTVCVNASSIEYVAGSGANSATILLDFDGSQIFNFGYNWNGSATSYDALSALDAGGSFVLDSSYSSSYHSWFINDMAYPGGTKYAYTDYAGWTLYESTDGVNWVLDEEGVSLSPLVNGGYNAWVWTNYDQENNWMPFRAPGQLPAPEPATMALLGLGTMALVRKRK